MRNLEVGSTGMGGQLHNVLGAQALPMLFRPSPTSPFDLSHARPHVSKTITLAPSHLITFKVKEQRTHSFLFLRH